ncbi:hypothetical protein [Salibacterium aidingense]|uniref:hypothetical protein n=1 Tax=Salibacterium aidingense TaxID=384933 RepID=UPI0003F7DE94|nr:hypothetical protein [Salibacterium aidingense]
MAEVQRKLQEFTQTATELKAIWNRLPEVEKKQYLKQYPFHKDLPDVVEDITVWNDEVRKL